MAPASKLGPPGSTSGACLGGAALRSAQGSAESTGPKRGQLRKLVCLGNTQAIHVGNEYLYIYIYIYLYIIATHIDPTSELNDGIC